MKYLSKIKKVNLLYVMKAGLGSALAIILADRFGLIYSPSAGIITLLTLQNTKKETIFIALKRFVSFFLAVLISYLLFTGIGYTPIVFGAFVLLFVALCILLGLKDGISMNSVLMTHFLIEQRVDLPLFLNELGLLTVGMGIGIILNLIMPKNKEKIRNEQLILEEEIKTTLRGLASMLRQKDACFIQESTDEWNENDLQKIARDEVVKNLSDTFHEVDFAKLDTQLTRLLKNAYEEADNTLLSDTRYLLSYLEMRKMQVDVLKDIKKNIDSVPVILKQSFPIATFLEHISESFHELNNVAELFAELEELKDYFRKDNLPHNREEFEFRAVLFQVLKELEYFLLLKRNFILELEEKNMKSYWS